MSSLYRVVHRGAQSLLTHCRGHDSDSCGRCYCGVWWSLLTRQVGAVVVVVVVIIVVLTAKVPKIQKKYISAHSMVNEKKKT